MSEEDNIGLTTHLKMRWVRSGGWSKRLAMLATVPMGDCEMRGLLLKTQPLHAPPLGLPTALVT